MKTLFISMEVFFGRMLDVSIGSARTIYLVKGKTIVASILSFIEILIWFFVSREILVSKDLNFFVITSYASGYAIGTYVGGLINKYLVSGNLTCMIVTSKKELIEILKENNYGITVLSLDEDKLLLLVEFKKKNLKKLKRIIDKKDRNAFMIINESLQVQNGYIK